jgi:hypothetical protein
VPNAGNSWFVVVEVRSLGDSSTAQGLAAIGRGQHPKHVGEAVTHCQSSPRQARTGETLIREGQNMVFNSQGQCPQVPHDGQVNVVARVDSRG